MLRDPSIAAPLRVLLGRYGLVNVVLHVSLGGLQIVPQHVLVLVHNGGDDGRWESRVLTLSVSTLP